MDDKLLEKINKSQNKKTTRPRKCRKFKGYIFCVSTRKHKKYDAYTKNGEYITSFGDRRYSQFQDQIGFYRTKNHFDTTRLKAYYARFGEDAEFESAKWFSHKFLW